MFSEIVVYEVPKASKSLIDTKVEIINRLILGEKITIEAMMLVLKSPDLPLPVIESIIDRVKYFEHRLQRFEKLLKSLVG